MAACMVRPVAEAVVDDDDGVLRNAVGQTRTGIGGHAQCHFPRHAGLDLLDLTLTEPQSHGRTVVEDGVAVLVDGSESELGLEGHVQLARVHGDQGSAQVFCDASGYEHAPARDARHHARPQAQPSNLLR